MKDLTLSAAMVMALALCLGLLFHWLYPLVTMTSEMAGLFFFVALMLKLVVGKMWSLRRKREAPPTAEAGK